MTTPSEDNSREILSLIRRLMSAPLLGATKTELVTVMHISAANVQLCLESLSADKRIVPTGQRNGETVYGVLRG